MKFRLHVVYADDDAISTLPRPMRWCCAFLSESLTPEREVGGSVPTFALLCRYVTFEQDQKNRCEVGIMKSPTCLYEKGASNALLLRSTILKILTEFRLIAVECRCISTSTHVFFEEKSVLAAS